MILEYVQEFYWQIGTCIGFSFIEFPEDQPRKWFFLSHAICFEPRDLIFRYIGPAALINLPYQRIKI